MPTELDHARPALYPLGPATGGALVLMLHGGRATSVAPVRRGQLAYQRVAALGRAAARARPGLHVVMLRFRLRGWNGAAADPLADTNWALDSLGEEFPGAGVTLVGHSMGGRAALRFAAHPSVRAVCALAPWIPPGEPVSPFAGVPALIAHGTRDRWTDPDASRSYARAAGIPWRAVEGSGHTMLRHRGAWHALVTDFLAPPALRA